MKFIANVLSGLLHPLFLINIGLFFILYFHPDYNVRFYDKQLYSFLFYLALNTILMPILVVFLLKNFKLIDSLTLQNQKQRTLPYLLIAFVYAVAVYYLIENDFNGLPIHFMIACIICLVANVLFNFFYKISSHAIAAGGLLGLIGYILFVQKVAGFGIVFSIALIILGLCGFSRLWLKQHTLWQIISGTLLGILIVMVTLITLNMYK